MKRALIIVQGILMAFLAFFVVSLIYSIVTGIFILITGIDDISAQVDYCLMVIAVMVSFILFFLWYKKHMRNGVVERVNLKEIFTLKNMGIYLMMGIGCQLFVSGVLAVLRPLLENLFAYYDETISSIFVEDTIIAAVYIVILAPVIEELMLRGIMFNRLRYGLPFAAANLLQAVVFGIYHWDIIQGMYAFGIGLLLGYVYEKTRTLLAPILVHVIINGSGFLLQQLQLGKYIPVIPAIIAGGAAMFGAIYLLHCDRNSI